MAKRVAGVTEKLMEAAKQEFLKNGYERASLQTIAEKAGSSKGAIYIRYPDKESLYRSLVQPAMDDFCGMIQSALQQFNQLPGTEQTSQMYSFSDQWFWASVDYIYDHFDEFKLLLTSGENNTYQEFLHRIVELDNQCTMRYIQASRNDAISSGRLTPELGHLLSSAFIPECSRWSSMICQRIRRLSISKGCGVSTPPGGDLSSSEMEVKTIERVD